MSKTIINHGIVCNVDIESDKHIFLQVLLSTEILLNLRQLRMWQSYIHYICEIWCILVLWILPHCDFSRTTLKSWLCLSYSSWGSISNSHDLTSVHYPIVHLWKELWQSLPAICESKLGNVQWCKKAKCLVSSSPYAF